MGILIIDNDESLFKEWKVEINMVDEYNNYLTTNNIKEFNSNFTNKLLEYTDMFSINAEKLKTLLNDLKLKSTYDECVDIYEEIYDILDENAILIKINPNTNEK